MRGVGQVNLAFGAEGASMTVSSTDGAVQARPKLSPRRAAATIVFTLLFAVMFAAFLPRYVPIFDRWPASWGEVPALTHALMSIGRLGVWPIVLAGVGLVAVLAGVAAGWIWAGLPCGRAVVLAIAVAGLGAFVACLAGTLGQVITAPVVPMK